MPGVVRVINSLKKNNDKTQSCLNDKNWNIFQLRYFPDIYKCK